MDFILVVTQSRYFLVDFDPIAFSVGPLDVRWYGIMYLLAFLFFLAAGKWTVRRRPWLGWKPEDVGDMLFYGMLGVVVGGRLGYVLFYGLDSFLADPLFLFKTTEGGMSFHGGLLGVMAAMWWFGRKSGRGFWAVSDFAAPLVPIGLALGRFGNFIGGELWGRTSEVPWAMIFPNSIQHGGWASERLREAWQAGALDHLARHPSQLYQMMGEGIALFILLALYSRVPRPAGAVSGMFLAGYGFFRLIAEFFREPDAHIGYLAGGWLTMGMLLTLPMIAAGLLLIALAARRGVESG